MARVGRVSAEMNHEAIAGGVPCIGAGREEIDDDAGNRRTFLKLIGAQRADLIGLHADSLLRSIQAGVWQIDDEADGIADLLNRRNHRTRRENLDGRSVFLLNDAETFDSSNFCSGGCFPGRLFGGGRIFGRL